MRNLWLLAVAVAALASPAAAETLRPGGWGVDWGEQYCALSHRPADNPDLMAVWRLVPGSAFGEMMLLQASWPDQFSAVSELRVLVDGVPLDPPLRAVATSIPAVGLVALQSFMTPRPALDTMIVGGRIDFMSRGEAVAAFGIGGGAQALTAVRECERSRLEEWGVDPDRPSAEYARDILRHFDGTYPHRALVNRQTGSVLILLVANSDGRLRDCRILVGSGHSELDEASCNVMRRRARFVPFEGEARMKTQRITWGLPG